MKKFVTTRKTTMEPLTLVRLSETKRKSEASNCREDSYAQ